MKKFIHGMLDGYTDTMTKTMRDKRQEVVAHAIEEGLTDSQAELVGLGWDAAITFIVNTSKEANKS